MTKPIAEICSISISSGLFPSDLKISKLKLLHKKESKTNPENFRPIFLLQLTSKVIERIVCYQVDNFLLRNNILYKYQSQYRKHHSTDFCLPFLSDKILKGFDKRLSTGMTLIDLQKADTINHETVLRKLHAIGFPEKAIAWFKSHLSQITCGVFQGSTLDPLLFYYMPIVYPKPFIPTCFYMQTIPV